MKNDSKFHVFHQESPNEKLFTYGKAKYTRSEVDIMIKLLPKDHKHIVIQWVKPPIPEWHPNHPKNKNLNTQTNANNN